MRFRISRYVDMSRSLRALRAFHTAFGEILNPYRASK